MRPTSLFKGHLYNTTSLNYCTKHTVEHHSVQVTLGRNKHQIKKKGCTTPEQNTLCQRETRRICNSDLQNNFQGRQEGLEIYINLHTFEFETLFTFHEVVQSTEFFNQSGKQKGIILCVEKRHCKLGYPKNAEDKFKFLLRKHNRTSPGKVTLGRNKHQKKKKKRPTHSRSKHITPQRETRRICNGDLQNNFQGCQEGLEIYINLHTFEFETLFPFHEVVHSTEFFSQSGKQEGIVVRIEKARF
ncbi:hypothetical protein CEXT_419021 [Caerostris extrusa]|uniref:Ribosomal protein L5 n=1 Tax=Caerostris extrusa TaxID=172846 RepID=A0AAV4S084_CAEEX|nr:hypothetical protein CEXT_419021 [Caerostris extrusa]